MPTFGAGCAIELWGWLSLAHATPLMAQPTPTVITLCRLTFISVHYIFLLRVFLYSDSSCQELIKGKQTKHPTRPPVWLQR